MELMRFYQINLQLNRIAKALSPYMDLMPFYPELSSKHENSNGLNALRIRVPLHVNT